MTIDSLLQSGTMDWTLTCLHILVSSSVLSLPQAELLHQEYFTEARLRCDTTGNETFGNSLEVNKYWLLPDGTFINQETKHRNKLKIDTNFTLYISKISDEDFGLYYCISVLNDSGLYIQRHGLNIDGANFDTLNQSYARRAVTGVIAAVGILVFMLGVFLIYHLRFSKKAKRKKMILDDLNKGIDRFNTQFYDNVGFEAYSKRSSFRKTTQRK